jgi:hypothetical protein
MEINSTNLQCPTFGGHNRASLALITMVSAIALFTEVVSFFGYRTGVVAERWNQSVLWDVILVSISLFFIYRFFASPRGLWVKRKREINLLQLLNMAIRGEFKDNPLVSLIVTVLGTVIAGVIMKLLGLL